jgi:D-glycero-alpha-D-manno-heptose 1-phosphate guanylyltransferase
MSQKEITDIASVVLAGGLGTRLRQVLPAIPKPLAKVGRKPFLQLLIHQLVSQGIRHIVICTGYLADQIDREIGNGSAWGAKIEYSREHTQLGTAGALKLAARLLANYPQFLAMNGDSFLEADFGRLIRCHRAHGGIASIAVHPFDDVGRYGAVEADARGMVTGFFAQSGQSAHGLINAGVYVFNHSVLRYIPEGPASLERDVFPCILEQGVYIVEHRGMFIDIGVPEDYARAQTLSDTLWSLASQQYRLNTDGAVEVHRCSIPA